MSKNVKNKTRVERMKKLLLSGNEMYNLDPTIKNSINELHVKK